MKRMILLFMFLTVARISVAQTFGEWFNQKSTQKKYLIEQIAALKVYAGYLKKGYDVGRKGLTTISNIKNGDFNLHRDFFGSLTVVNPAFKHYARVADMIEMQVAILGIRDKTMTNVIKSDWATDKDETYARIVFGRLMEDCSNLMDELGNVSLHSTLTLKDDERLQRIDAIYNHMLSNYRFANHFKAEMLTLLYTRQQENTATNKVKQLYGIK